MVHVFICDNNSLIRRIYKKQVDTIAKKNDLQVRVCLYQSSGELLADISQNPQLPDIIYIDVAMAGINGVEAAGKLRQLGCDAQIIFLANSEQYVFEAFNVMPLHYLTKDKTDAQKFEEVFLRAVDKISRESKNLFTCRRNYTIKRIPYSNILYFASSGHVVNVHYEKEKTFSFYETLENLSDSLKEKGFIRVHRSYLVNIVNVKQMDKKRITLNTGQRLPLSDKYCEGFDFAPQLFYSIRA